MGLNESDHSSNTLKPCRICGGGPGSTAPCTCQVQGPYDAPPATLGWICPNCGAGMSPYATRCGCKDSGIVWGGSEL